MNENEFVGEFVYLCETSNLDPEDALSILNAQDWHADDEDHVTIPAFTFSDDV